jgi:hypothetical protein
MQANKFVLPMEYIKPFNMAALIDIIDAPSTRSIARSARPVGNPRVPGEFSQRLCETMIANTVAWSGRFDEASRARLIGPGERIVRSQARRISWRALSGRPSGTRINPEAELTVSFLRNRSTLPSADYTQRERGPALILGGRF